MYILRSKLVAVDEIAWLQKFTLDNQLSSTKKLPKKRFEIGDISLEDQTMLNIEDLQNMQRKTA